MEKAIKRYWPVFVLPTLAAFIIGFVWPFIQGLYLSFCKFITIDKASFNGLKNYIFALTEADFLHSFWFTALFTVVSTACINVAALAIALALTREIKGTNLFRSVFFMPNLIGGIVLGYIWNILLNCVLTLLGKPLLSLHAPYGFIGLVILMCWQQIGYMMIIYIAGLQSIPNDYLEAARIDGANEHQILWKVKRLNLMPSITICLFLTLTNSFKLFDQNLALTGGAPIRTMADGSQLKMTEMLALNIKSTFDINQNWHGVAQAKAVVFFVLVAVLASSQLYFTRKKEGQRSAAH